MPKEGNSSKEKKHQWDEQAKEWEKKVETLWQSINIKTIKELKKKKQKYNGPLNRFFFNKWFCWKKYKTWWIDIPAKNKYKWPTDVWEKYSHQGNVSQNHSDMSGHCDKSNYQQ